MNTPIICNKPEARVKALELARAHLRTSGEDYAAPDAEPHRWVLDAIEEGMEAMRASRTAELKAEHTLVVDAITSRMDPTNATHVTIAAVLEAIALSDTSELLGDPCVWLDLERAVTVSDRFTLEYSRVEEGRVQITLRRKVLQS